jgi:hypothetical protein
VNRRRLSEFMKVVLPRHKPRVIAWMVQSDDMFQSHPREAYAEAWALTYYLLETQSHRYAEYLKRINSHGAFQQVSASERVADFSAVFGSDWRMIEAHFLRFMAAIK